MQLDLGSDPGLIGQTLFGRVYIDDPAAANGLAITQAFQINVFGVSDELMSDGFE